MRTYKTNEMFSRIELQIGIESMNKLLNSKVLIVGVGGVGGYTLEALVRSGIGEVSIYDGDDISVSNLNRQLIATSVNIGLPKVDEWQKRVNLINPETICEANKVFLDKSNIDSIDFASFSYIVDACDTISTKILLIEKAKEFNIPIISSMGAGNKMNPNCFLVADISKTSVCPLARVMRYELKKRGIEKVKVVFSKEEPIKTNVFSPETNKMIPGSNAFVPSSAGLLIASEVIKDLIK